MNWIPLTELSQLEFIRQDSLKKPVVIFKHSTRCSISDMAKNRLERESPPADITFYYLDLIAYRPISSAIAAQFDVFHESPQVLIIHNQVCMYDQSHNGITMNELKEQLSLLQQ